MTFEVGQEVEWDVTHGGPKRGRIVYGPYPNVTGTLMVLIGCPRYSFPMRCADVRPAPPPVEYEVLCYRSDGSLSHWQLVTDVPGNAHSPSKGGYLRRVAGDDSTAEWIAGDTGAE